MSNRRRTKMDAPKNILAVLTIVLIISGVPWMPSQAHAYSKSHRVSVTTEDIDLGIGSVRLDYSLNVEVSHGDSYGQGDSQEWSIRITSGELRGTVNAYGQTVSITQPLALGRTNAISYPVVDVLAGSLNLDAFATAQAAVDVSGPARISDSTMNWQGAGPQSFLLTIDESATNGDEITVRIPVVVILNAGLSIKSLLGDVDLATVPIGNFRATPVIVETIVVGSWPLAGLELWIGIVVAGASGGIAYAIKRSKSKREGSDIEQESKESRREETISTPSLGRRPRGLFLVASMLIVFGIIGFMSQALNLVERQPTTISNSPTLSLDLPPTLFYVAYFFSFLNFVAAAGLLLHKRAAKRLTKFLCVVYILAAIVTTVIGSFPSTVINDSIYLLNIPAIIILAAILYYLGRPHIKDYFEHPDLYAFEKQHGRAGRMMPISEQPHDDITRDVKANATKIDAIPSDVLADLRIGLKRNRDLEQNLKSRLIEGKISEATYNDLKADLAKRIGNIESEIKKHEAVSTANQEGNVDGWIKISIDAGGFAAVPVELKSLSTVSGAVRTDASSGEDNIHPFSFFIIPSSQMREAVQVDSGTAGRIYQSVAPLPEDFSSHQLISEHSFSLTATSSDTYLLIISNPDASRGLKIELGYKVT